jgi:hypothetical protein
MRSRWEVGQILKSVMYPITTIKDDLPVLLVLIRGGMQTLTS